jgi:phosphopantothenoylcysteine decarboxylase / phosphopantothenate---cysteine ligase
MGIKDLNIVLGVSGGIAAYKAVDLLRRLSEGGANVAVIMTRHAQRFVGPLTFQALTPHGVYSDLFAAYRPGAMDHIQLAQWANLVVLAPATANIIAKAAQGIADDLLSTFLLASPAPKLFCPAMNVHMYENRVLQSNLEALRSQGYFILEPSSGPLACGEEGKGRLPEVSEIVEKVLTVTSPQDLIKEKVLITAGGTREFMDPIRFLGNPATGKMGFALARVAKRRGAEVTLVTGPTHLEPPAGIKLVPITTALEMEREVLKAFPRSTIVVKSAAVSDYRPEKFNPQKVKKKQGAFHLPLVLNPDILHQLGQRKRNQFLIGFAAETEDLLTNARQKLKEKKLDLIVANPIGQAGAGFGTNTNQVLLIFADGRTKTLPVMAKEDVAHFIFDYVVRQRGPNRLGRSKL